MVSQEIFALRRQGQTAQALAMARDAYPNHNSDIWLIRAYAWCLYDHVKKIVSDYENGILPNNQLSRLLSPYMQEFAKIGLPLKKDTCFSQMLNLANKASKDWNEFLYFSQWAGLDCFSDNDKNPYTTDNGTQIDSLQSRYLRAIVREISIHQSHLNAETIQWGEMVIKFALKLNPNDQWLHYYKSKVDLYNGNIDLAIQSIMPVIHRQPKSYWVWGLLASILENTQPENSLICYIYASQLSHNEQELAKIRITLAIKLAQHNRFSEASFQIQKALEYRHSNNFNIPDTLQQLQNTNWYKAALQNNDIKKCSDVKESAQEILTSLDKDNIFYQKVVIDHHNKNKKMAYVLINENEGMPMYYGKFPDIKNLSIGTVLEITCSKLNNKKPLTFKFGLDQEIQGLCRIFTGDLSKIPNKNFAFIASQNKSIFVPPTIAENYQHNTTYQVQCKALKTKDKQGKIGWRAVEISNLD